MLKQNILFTVAVIQPDGTRRDAPEESETFEQLLGLLTRKGMALLIKRTD